MECWTCFLKRPTEAAQRVLDRSITSWVNGIAQTPLGLSRWDGMAIWPEAVGCGQSSLFTPFGGLCLTPHAPSGTANSPAGSPESAPAGRLTNRARKDFLGHSQTGAAWRRLEYELPEFPYRERLAGLRGAPILLSMMAFRTLRRGGWRRAVCIALAVGATGAAAVPGVRLWQETTAHEWRLPGLGTLARARLAAGAEKHALQRYEWSAGEVSSMPLAAVAADPKIDRTRARILGVAVEAGWRGLGAGGAAGLAALVLLAGWRHSIYGGAAERPPARGGGRSASRPRARLSGSLFGRMALPMLAAMPWRAVRIAGIPYPKEAGRGHTLVLGAAGSGRQAVIADLVAGVRARGGRCIVLDRTGEYTRRLFAPARDALLNPLDARAAAWSPSCDARGRGDLEAMAAALIPDPADAGGAVAALAARQLFVEVAEALRRRGDTGNGALLDLLLETAPEALAGMLVGTPARAALARVSLKVLPGARALLRHHLAALRFGTGGDFSIRDWVARGDGLLFLASPDDRTGRLRGLVSAWTEIAVGAALSLDPGGGLGLWIVIDEPEALHRLPSLLPALGGARGAGVRFAVGIEALGPLRARYGADGAGTVAGLCATRAALAAADEETAEWCSDAIGSESLAPAWRLRRLAPGQGVLRFPGRRDAVEFSLKESPARGAAARFAPVEGARMFLDEAPAPPAPARKPAPRTGGPAKKTDKAARAPASAETTGAGNEDGERPAARPVRKRRRAGRWI